MRYKISILTKDELITYTATSLKGVQNTISLFEGQENISIEIETVKKTSTTKVYALELSYGREYVEHKTSTDINYLRSELATYDKPTGPNARITEKFQTASI